MNEKEDLKKSVLTKTISEEVAVKFLSKKANAPTTEKAADIARNWSDQAISQSFFSARVAKADILEALRHRVNQVASGEASTSEARYWVKEFLKTDGASALQELGFLPVNSQDVLSELGGTRRINLIIEQNVRQAHAVGEYAQHLDAKEFFPYLQYLTRDDGNVRSSHAQLHGKIFKADDPIWATIMPPNDFNCFPVDTEILTQNGYKPIQTLKTNDLVIGGSGNAKSINRTFKRRYIGNMTSVKVDDIEVLSTPNHRYLTLRGWVRAENLTINDILVHLPKKMLKNSVIGNINKLKFLRFISNNFRVFFSKSKRLMFPFQCWNIVKAHNFFNGSISGIITNKNILNTQSFLDINGIEGFGDGAPLDRFDSLYDFSKFAFRNYNLLNISEIKHNIHYNGYVYNLEVKDDNTYIIPISIVHNCRCYVRQLSAEEVEGKTISSKPPDGAATAKDLAPDSGYRFDVTRGFGQVMNAKDTWSDEIKKKYEGQVVPFLKSEISHLSKQALKFTGDELLSINSRIEDLMFYAAKIVQGEKVPVSSITPELTSATQAEKMLMDGFSVQSNQNRIIFDSRLNSYLRKKKEKGDDRYKFLLYAKETVKNNVPFYIPENETNVFLKTFPPENKGIAEGFIVMTDIKTNKVYNIYKRPMKDFDKSVKSKKERSQ